MTLRGENCVTKVSQLTHYYNSQKIRRVKASHPVIKTKVIHTYDQTIFFYPQGVVNAGMAWVLEPLPSCPIYEERVNRLPKCPRDSITSPHGHIVNLILHASHEAIFTSCIGPDSADLHTIRGMMNRQGY